MEKLKRHPEIKEAANKRRLNFHHVDIGPTRRWGYPRDDGKIRQWQNYWCEPFLTNNDVFDLILIDGRFRVSCALAAAIFAPDDSKILIHDYQLRAAYYEIEKFFTTIDEVDSLYVMQRRSDLNHRSLYVSILRHQFQQS